MQLTHTYTYPYLHKHPLSTLVARRKPPRLWTLEWTDFAGGAKTGVVSTTGTTGDGGETQDEKREPRGRERGGVLRVCNTVLLRVMIRGGDFNDKVDVDGCCHADRRCKIR